jgi:hypothetical protein
MRAIVWQRYGPLGVVAADAGAPAVPCHDEVVIKEVVRGPDTVTVAPRGDRAS